jgi:uncharacterized membrane protein YphA (DoxX/SURF4 family)
MKTNIKNIILLAIRLYVGYIMVTKGYAKLMNMEGTTQFLGNLTGLSSPFIWAVALGEFLSGLGMIFGVWTRLAAAGTAIILIGVLFFAGHTVAVPLLIGALILVVFGGGKWALVTYKSKSEPIVAADTTDLPKF